MDSPSLSWIPMLSRAWIVCSILGSNKEGSEGEGFRRVSRIVIWIREVWVSLEHEIAVLADDVGSDVLASLAAETKERAIRITELSNSFSLRKGPLRRWTGPRSSSSSSSESVKYESISRNSARIFEFLILFPG